MVRLKTRLKWTCQGILDGIGLTRIERGSLLSVGNLDYTSRVKFVRYMPLQLPFSLARTVRGLKPSVDPFAQVLQGGTITSLPLEFKERLSLHLDWERDKLLKDIGYKGVEFLELEPLWCSVLPWQNGSVATHKSLYLRQVEENRTQFLPQAYRANYSFNDLIVESHYAQFNQLLRSIRLHGYQKKLCPLPRINILISGKEWRWMMTGQGNHRFYLTHMLESETFFGEVDHVITREEWGSWPQVKNGVFTKKQALSLFDRTFEGNEPTRGIV